MSVLLSRSTVDAGRAAPTPGALNAQRLSTSSLPIIDIGPLYRRNMADRKKVAEAIGEAAHEVGFFYIANHPILQSQIDAVYAEAERFFALPLAEKLRHYIAKSPNHRGYVPQFERGDYADEKQRLYEAFDLALDLPEDDPDYNQGSRLLGPNQWPALDGFRETVYDYYRAVSDLSQTLCRAFEIHLKLAPGYFRQFMQKPPSQLRLLHYLENDAPLSEQNMQMGAHTDYECFTILHQAKPALQVLNMAGEWMEAPPIEGTYVINIGDMMEAWSNGHFKSTPHRVVNSGRERFSLPYFCAADFDTEIKPVSSMVSADKFSRYPKLVAGHHLLGQLLRDFAYLRRRYQQGKLKLPFEVPTCNRFEGRLAAPVAA